MRVLIIFNHPAPYKVNAFNELNKYVDLTVLFERTHAKDRPASFYKDNHYEFQHEFLKDGYIGSEGTISNNVKRYIKTLYREYDLIIMNGYSHLAEIKAIRYMARHHIRFGLLINGGIANKKEFFLKRMYKSSLIKKASYYLSPSKAANEYLKYYGADEKDIYNYYYCNLFNKEISAASKKEKDTYRQKYNLPLDKKIFINPSQFIDRKNNLYLISLFKGRKDVLVLVGDGPLKEQYQKFIKDNNMDNVIIVPYKSKDKLFEMYKASDVHITLSKKDIFGHTVLESLANGVPVIASNNIVSAIEYIKDGYNGYVVDLNKKEEILNAMDNCDNTMQNNALESVKSNTFESSAKSIYEILKKIYE